VKKVCIINGSSNTGKDTLITIFDKLTKQTVFNYSTIDNIRNVFRSLGYKGNRMEFKYRKLLSDIKSFLIEYDDIPFKDAVEQFKIYDYFTDNFIMFIHCREPTEIKKLVDYFGDTCVTLLIKRNGLKTPDNKSDMNVDDYDYDYTILNTAGIKELEHHTLNLIKKLEET